MSNDISELPANPARRDLAAIVFALAFPTLMTWVYFILLTESSSGLQLAAKSIGMVIQFGFPVFWVVCVQKQRLSWPRPKRDGLLIGGLFGLTIMAATFAAYFLWLKPSGAFDSAAVAVREKIVAFGINSTVKYAALSAFFVVLHSLLEEYYWRWFVFAQLRRVTTLGQAIAISGLGFMAHHLIVLSVYFGWGTFLSLFFSLGVAVGGVAWAWLYHRSRSLYGPWLSHCLVDAGIFAVGYEILSSQW